MNFLVDDGGRAVAGFKGKAGDCVVRAIAIATERPYREIYDAINREGKQESRRHARRSTARGGVFKLTFKRYRLGLGWHWIPTMKIGQGCRVHLRSAELPSQGRLIVSLSRHLTAVVDGVIHDTYDPSRHGTRCVYGYFSRDAVELPDDDGGVEVGSGHCRGQHHGA